MNHPPAELMLFVRNETEQDRVSVCLNISEILTPDADLNAYLTRIVIGPELA